jgi:hypothetical protein
LVQTEQVVFDGSDHDAPTHRVWAQGMKVGLMSTK